MYYGNKTLKPIEGLSNGIVIAIGHVSRNIGFFKYVNSLNKYLVSDKSFQGHFSHGSVMFACALGPANRPDNVPREFTSRLFEHLVKYRKKFTSNSSTYLNVITSCRI